MKRNPVIIVTAIIIVLIFASALVGFQVRQSEVAAVTTFGKYSRTLDRPGLYFRLPWPIQNVYRFDNRIQNFEKKYEQIATQDGRILIAQVFVGWKLTDAKVFLERFNGDMNQARRRLEDLVRDAKNSVFGRHPFSDLISTSEEKLKFTEIEQEMLTAIQSQAANAYGIEVVLLGIKQIGLPEGITTKVFERMKAEREELVLKYRGEGEAQALSIRSDADKQRENTLAAAEAQVRGILGDAQALKTFERNPELAVFLLKLDALELALKERATLVLDPSTAPFDLLRAGKTDAAPPVPPQPNSETATAP